MSVYKWLFIHGPKVSFVTKLLFHPHKLNLHILTVPVLNCALQRFHIHYLVWVTWVHTYKHADTHVPESIAAQNSMQTAQHYLLRHTGTITESWATKVLSHGLTSLSDAHTWRLTKLDCWFITTFSCPTAVAHPNLTSPDDLTHTYIHVQYLS